MTSTLRKIAPNDFSKGLFAGIGLMLLVFVLLRVF